MGHNCETYLTDWKLKKLRTSMIIFRVTAAITGIIHAPILEHVEHVYYSRHQRCFCTSINLPICSDMNDHLASFFMVSGGEPPGTRSIVAYSWARRLALDYRPTKQCDNNGTRRMSLNAYKMPGTMWLETIPRQLFLYSAHLDFRVVGYPNIKVIGVKRGALTPSVLFCTIW